MTDHTKVELYSVDYQKALIDEGFFTVKFTVREHPIAQPETLYELQKDIEKLIKEKYQLKVDDENREAV